MSIASRIQTNFLNPEDLSPNGNTFANLLNELRRPENFLNRRVDLMTDRVNGIIEDAIQRKNETLFIDHDVRASLWKIAGWATIVATIALTVGTMITVGYLFPIYVPIVPIVSYLLWQYVLENASRICFENAKKSESTYEYKKKVKETYEQEFLDHSTPEGIETRIRVELNHYFNQVDRDEIDLELRDVIRQHDLRPVLAEYITCKSEIKIIAERSRELDMQALDQLRTVQNSTQESLEQNRDVLRKTLEKRELARNEYASEMVRLAKYISILAQPRQSTHFQEQLQFYQGGTPLNQLGREALHLLRPRAVGVFDLYPNRTDTLILPESEECLTRHELETIHPALLGRLLTKAFNSNN